MNIWSRGRSEQNFNFGAGIRDIHGRLGKEIINLSRGKKIRVEKIIQVKIMRVKSNRVRSITGRSGSNFSGNAGS